MCRSLHYTEWVAETLLRQYNISCHGTTAFRRGPIDKMEVCSPQPSQLTPLDVEDILSAISSFRLDPTIRSESDGPVFEALRANIRPMFTGAMLPAGGVKLAKDKLRRKFLCALVTPGISDGSRAASANTEPLTQAVLKAAQSAGAKNAGNPVNELLSMSARRAGEYVFTAVDTGAPPPEWYGIRPGQQPPHEMADIDTLLAIAMEEIVPVIEPIVVRTRRGGICSTHRVICSDGNLLINAVPPEMRAPGKAYAVHVIDFSVSEALKLRRTPHKVLGMILEYLQGDGYLSTAPCSAILLPIEPETFSIAIWSPDSTVSLAAANGVVGIGAESDELTSFELTQTPTVRGITAVCEISAAAMGLLAPLKKDGSSARVWKVSLANPVCPVPAKHVALLLTTIGFHVSSCSRNSAGRCDELTVAEWDLSVECGGGTAKQFADWVEREAELRGSWELMSREGHGRAAAWRTSPLMNARILGERLWECSGNYGKFREIVIDACAHAPEIPSDELYVPPSRDEKVPIVTWKSGILSLLAPYVTYQSLKYRGSSRVQNTSERRLSWLPFRRCMQNLQYDWEVTYTNLIPEMARTLCAYVARQAMDLEWIVRVAGSKVSQSSADYVTVYGCGTGPVLQAVKQGAIGLGGPLAALNESPVRVFTDAALASKTYTTAGSQAEIVTGSASRTNGATSVQIVPAETATTSLVQHRCERAAITEDASMLQVRSCPGGSEWEPEL